MYKYFDLSYDQLMCYFDINQLRMPVRLPTPFFFSWGIFSVAVTTTLLPFLAFEPWLECVTWRQIICQKNKLGPCSSLYHDLCLAPFCVWWVWKSMTRRDLTNLLNSSDSTRESNWMTGTECYLRYYVINAAHFGFNFMFQPVTWLALLVTSNSVITAHSVPLNSAY